ncbi:Sensor histidine kinase desK [Actinomyces bovis]|uniref:Sensor histidine kinase desK n=1 Tax=Actinomyces bovis TaxID=1658 RepID=A0ABY1VNM1_9ACTO|nr:histidine kinase [Actinomyces bovis]SPT52663.1 Sensor histidine kinase desK [Actinomyces bovis]VEG54570.1 Sensor histidine kinase desK [Actinomyces israelii]
MNPASPSSAAHSLEDAALSSYAKPWYRRIDWANSIWVILLLAPLYLTWVSDASLAIKGVTIASLIAFGVADVWSVSTMKSWLEVPVGATLKQQLQPVAGRLALLVAVALPSLPLLRWTAVFYLPYLAAILLFATPLRTGVTGTLVLCAMAVTVTALFAPGWNHLWMALGCAGSSTAVSLGRITADVTERRRVKEVELATSEQREEIGRDVHDILGHTLTVLTLKAEVAQRLVRGQPDQAEAELTEIIELSRSALADVRATVTRLRTPDLASQLEASRTAFAAAGVEAVFKGAAAAVPAEQRQTLAWALREATTNVIRHAAASRVQVWLGPGLLRVVDDGVGLPAGSSGAESNGLRGLRERVTASDGQVVITSPVDGAGADPARPGCCLEVRL